MSVVSETLHDDDDLGIIYYDNVRPTANMNVLHGGKSKHYEPHHKPQHGHNKPHQSNKDYKYIEKINISSIHTPKDEEELEYPNNTELYNFVFKNQPMIVNHLSNIAEHATKDEFSRILNMSQFHGLFYHRRRGEFKKGLHWGQLKLFLSEVEFILLAYEQRKKDKLEHLPIHLVYAGAAPGNHILTLYELFPDVYFHLYDPNNFRVKYPDPQVEPEKYQRAKEHIHIHQQFFTNADAASWATYLVPNAYIKTFNDVVNPVTEQKTTLAPRTRTNSVNSNSSNISNNSNFSNLSGDISDDNDHLPQQPQQINNAFVTDEANDIGKEYMDTSTVEEAMKKIHPHLIDKTIVRESDKAAQINHTGKYARYVVFVSDVRSDEPTVATIMFDMHMQKEWMLLMRAYLHMVKFRLPWHDDASISGNEVPPTTTYFSGDIYIQLYPGPTSTETRLIFGRDAEMIEYNNKLYEDEMFYHNGVTRRKYYTYESKNVHFDRVLDLKTDGVCNCYDCIGFVHLVDNYLNITEKLRVARYAPDSLYTPFRNSNAQTIINLINYIQNEIVGNDLNIYERTIKTLNDSAKIIARYLYHRCSNKTCQICTDDDNANSHKMNTMRSVAKFDKNVTLQKKSNSAIVAGHQTHPVNNNTVYSSKRVVRDISRTTIRQ